MKITFEKLSARTDIRGQSDNRPAPLDARGRAHVYPSGGTLAPSNAERAAKWFAYMFFGLFGLAPFAIAGVFILFN